MSVQTERNIFRNLFIHAIRSICSMHLHIILLPYIRWTECEYKFTCSACHTCIEMLVSHRKPHHWYLTSYTTSTEQTQFTVAMPNISILNLFFCSFRMVHICVLDLFFEIDTLKIAAFFFYRLGLIEKFDDKVFWMHGIFANGTSKRCLSLSGLLLFQWKQESAQNHDISPAWRRIVARVSKLACNNG